MLGLVVHRGRDSETYLDQARCMAHVTHAYHLQHQNLKTMMTALKQLNTAEEAQEDIHEVCNMYAKRNYWYVWQ